MRTALAVFRRDFAIERTYHFQFALSLLQTAVFGVGLYFISKLIEDPEALANYNGTYFDFVMAGLAVTSFAAVGLQSFGNSLVREQATGTIDLLLVAPTSPSGLMGGMFLFPFTLGSVQLVALLGFGIGVVGSGMPIGGLLLSVPILLLTTATFAAVGIAAAGILLLAKRGDPLTGPFSQISMIMSGAIFPLEILPSWAQAISVLFPATWGVRATRELLLNDAGWRDVVPEAVVLAGFTALMLPFGIWMMRRCIETGRRNALLGGY
jgi:ABC-2 type transport system permease protein